MRRAVPRATRCCRTARSWRMERMPLQPPPPRPPPMACPRILMGCNLPSVPCWPGWRRARRTREDRRGAGQVTETRRRMKVTMRKVRAKTAMAPTTAAITSAPLTACPDRVPLAPGVTRLTSCVGPPDPTLLAAAVAVPRATAQATTPAVAAPMSPARVRRGLRSGPEASVRTGTPDHRHGGLEDDLEIPPERPGRYVEEVELYQVVAGQVVASRDLPQARDARAHLEAAGR